MRLHRRQAGATLLVTLIMLIMLTLFALSAMNTSTTNLKMVGNMQARTEALVATQQAIETTISTPQFANTPTNAIPMPCGAPNTLCMDMNGDGQSDLITQLVPPPRCTQSRIVKIPELNITGPLSDDVACLQQQQQGTFAVAGAQTSGDSLCGSTVWDITARTIAAGATVATTNVSFTATQGVAVRVKALDLATACPAI